MMDREAYYFAGRAGRSDRAAGERLNNRFGRELVEREPGDRRPRRPLAARWWFWVLIALALQFIPWPAAWADAVYRRGTLPLWSALTTPLTEASGRSLSALLLLALVAVTLTLLLAGREARRAALRGLGGVVAVLAVTFPFVFGLGYHTTPLEYHLSGVGLSADQGAGRATEADKERVRNQVVELLGAAAQTNDPAATVGDLAAAPESSEAAPAPGPDGAAGAREPAIIVSPTDLTVEPPAPAAAAALCLERYLPKVVAGPLPNVPQRVKAVPESWLLRIGFSGVISPWLLEPHIDPALPPPAAMAVALHELAHTAGFAREAEAEAVGLLAGLACEERSVRYAAALSAAAAFLADLPTEERDAFLAEWPAGAVEDFRTANAIARNFRSAAAAEVAERVYDTYLSSQGGEGMSDYARAIDLVVLALAD